MSNEPLFAALILGRRDTLWWSLGLILFGFLLALLLVPFLRRWALNRNVLDSVDPLRKLHTQATPRIGGIALMVPFLIGTGLIAVFLHREMVEAALAREWFVMVAGCVAMFAVGLWDDFRPIGAKIKLFLQVVICTVVAVFGFQLYVLSNPFTGGQFELGKWGWFFAAFWLLSTTNLVNLIDGADGLAGGVCLIVFAALALTMWFTAGITMFLLCVLMIGTLLGFLIHNFPPARIFMGDGGAYFLGFLIGQVGLAGDHKSTVAAAMVVPLLALGVPIIDTVLAILRRGIRGLPLFRADREHVHHRLIDMGLSPQRAVMVIYLVCVVFCALGLVVFFQKGKGLAVSLGLMFTLGVAAMWALRYFRDLNPWEQIRRALNTRERTAQFVAMCKNWSQEISFGRIGADFYAKFWRDLEAQGFSSFSCTLCDGKKASFGSEPQEGNFLKIKLPIVQGQRTVAQLEFEVQEMNGLDARVWERHATLARDVVAEWLSFYKS
jgi:UDP-GlcNAc:undecaprenyl-phosphate GlcNAc-1-phosphate transferase